MFFSLCCSLLGALLIISSPCLSTSTFEDFKENFFIIVPIFNPVQYQSRYDLYFEFERYIRQQTPNLITIELVYGQETNFSVTVSNNSNHIQLRTGHPLWHKENLINIAVKRLPPNWEYVAFIDGDLSFKEEDWLKRLWEGFLKYDIIQVFKVAQFEGPKKEVIQTELSYGWITASKLPTGQRRPHPGFGWGMKREVFEGLGGVADFLIVGDGDIQMAYSLNHQLGRAFGGGYHPNYLIAMKEWEKKASATLKTGKIGFANLTLVHHFHGSHDLRQYGPRRDMLKDEKFDPRNDLFYDSNGVLQLKPTKTNLIHKISQYFSARREDHVNK